MAHSVELMKRMPAVITSVVRDDLPGLRAAHWAETIREVRKQNPNTTIVIRIPDFQG